MSKRKMCPASQLSAKKKANIGSSAERSEIQVPLISKGTSRFESGVLSFMFGISSQTGAMLRAQEVLLDKIESIAQRVETLSKEVLLMKEESARTLMREQDRSWLPSDEEIKAWLNSPIQSPTHGSIMDLTCSETPFQSLPPLNVQQFQSGGSTELPEWASLV
jgi:hypothetical protein